MLIGGSLSGVWFSGVVLFGREFVFSDAGLEIAKPVNPLFANLRSSWNCS